MYNRLFLLNFTICFLLTSIGIFLLKRYKLGQAIRKLGPKMHLRKSGTPNIGGVFIIISVMITFIFYLIMNRIDLKTNIRLIFMLFMPVLCYGTLGFLDDYIKAKSHKNDGISPKGKLFFQILWATLYFYIFLDDNTSEVNFFGKLIDIKWFYGVFILLSFVSTTNAFNLCDGIDGLAGGMGLIILTGFYFIIDNEIIKVFLILFISSISAFLIFNIHPAKIFMGDSGSLSLGAVICSLSIILKTEYLLIIFGLIMIIETLSVILQVLYYKITKGKRLFLMTPIHHHFELMGIKEEKVSIIFWIIELLLVIIGIYIYKLRG